MTTANDRMQTLLDATQKLIELVAQENHLLETDRPIAIKPLLAEKERLAAVYARDLAQVKAFGADDLKATDPLLRRDLSAALDQFQKLVMKNGKILLRLKTVGEGVLASISAEANRGREGVPLYSAHGRLAPRQNGGSLAVNARV